MPLNAFGVDLKASGFRWTEDLCRMDSDGDGRTNGEELGDPCCSWSVESPGQAETWPWEELGHPGVPDTERSNDGKDRYHPACPPTSQQSKQDDSPAVEPNRKTRTQTSRDTIFLENEPRRSRDFRTAAHNIPSTTEDTYLDFGFNFKDDECEHHECQIVGIQAILDNKQVVHHFVLTACAEAYVAPLGNGTAVPPHERCTERLAAWIPGRDFFMVAPPESGYGFGGKSGNQIKGFQLQIHYHNEEDIPFQQDSSGFRLFYTTKPRQMRLGSFFGTKVEWDLLNAIPPGKERYFVTEGCTVTGLEQPALMVYSIYHAHMLAHEMYTTLYRPDGQKIPVYAEQHWNFDDQYSADIKDKNITIRNGDYIQSTCVYDSTATDTWTTFGPRTQDEMCHGIYWIEPFPLGMQCASLGYWVGELAPGEDGHSVRELHPSRQGLPAVSIQDNRVCDPAQIQHLLENKEASAKLWKNCRNASVSEPARQQCALDVLQLFACTSEGKPGAELLSVEHKSLAVKVLQRLVTFATPGLLFRRQ